MKMKKFYTILFLAFIALGISLKLFWQMKQLPLKQPIILFKQADFEQLPGWKSADLKKSLQTFQVSCRAFIKQNPEQLVGTDHIDLQVKDWQPACEEALKITPAAEKKAKQFFEEWFTPIEFTDNNGKPGLFTGYYVPAVKGSYSKTKEFHVPIYETPEDLLTVDLGLFSNDLKNRRIIGRVDGKKFVPYYTREQINEGAIKKKAKVLVWINSPVDRLFLEIQGSGVIELEDGQELYIGYDAQNGAPYTAIAGVLIKQGVMTRHNASMQGIKRYLAAHPKEMDNVINQNKSFVFFKKMADGVALGSQGVALTPGYSLAIDKQWVPMGAPLWLNTTRPDSEKPDANKPMRRLMIAQDTGGAIRGKVRGDVFWGGGDKAILIAGHMKNEGHYWILLPKQAISRLEKNKLMSEESNKL